MVPQIVFSDVDGTLLNSRHEVSERTADAVRRLQEEGIPFVIISARSPSGIYSVMEDAGLACPIICYSGALILDEKKRVLFSEGMDKATAGAVTGFIEEQGLDCAWNVYSMDTWIVKDRGDSRVALEERITKVTAAEGDLSMLADDAPVGKILCICNPECTLEIEHAIKERFPELTVIKSSGKLLEIMAAGINKGNAVREFCSLYSIPVSAAMAFGDHYNDEDMLKVVGMPVVMGNAPEDLKERFPNVTAGNDEDGIEKWLRGRGTAP